MFIVHCDPWFTNLVYNLVLCINSVCICYIGNAQIVCFHKIFIHICFKELFDLFLLSKLVYLYSHNSVMYHGKTEPRIKNGICIFCDLGVCCLACEECCVLCLGKQLKSLKQGNWETYF